MPKPCNHTKMEGKGRKGNDGRTGTEFKGTERKGRNIMQEWNGERD